jgi:hypothetical protein
LQFLSSFLNLLLADDLPLSAVLMAIRLVIDLIGVVILLFFIFYRSYRNKELVTSAALFNVFVFSVLSVLSTVQFGINAGFGLFAILALFTLRSEPLAKIELTYCFGSVVVAVICAVQGTPLLLVILAVAIVIVGAYVVDHPRILSSMGSLKLTLDSIDADLLSDPTAMSGKLSSLLKVDVLSFHVLQVDYINDKASIDVNFRKHRF